MRCAEPYLVRLPRRMAGNKAKAPVSNAAPADRGIDPNQIHRGAWGHRGVQRTLKRYRNFSSFLLSRSSGHGTVIPPNKQNEHTYKKGRGNEKKRGKRKPEWILREFASREAASPLRRPFSAVCSSTSLKTLNSSSTFGRNPTRAMSVFGRHPPFPVFTRRNLRDAFLPRNRRGLGGTTPRG